ncbi:MAG: hypothetical protein P4N60_03325 [Verrucomicrobiae bacterium]|nr:hypothetical protein [Verrucomicrobiae bacterium]
MKPGGFSFELMVASLTEAGIWTSDTKKLGYGHFAWFYGFTLRKRLSFMSISTAPTPRRLTPLGTRLPQISKAPSMLPAMVIKFG